MNELSNLKAMIQGEIDVEEAVKAGNTGRSRGMPVALIGTEGDTFTMSWVERDGPPVSAPKRRGFGTIVIEAMTERSVDGKVELDYALSGVMTVQVASSGRGSRRRGATGGPSSRAFADWRRTESRDRRAAGSKV